MLGALHGAIPEVPDADDDLPAAWGHVNAQVQAALDDLTQRAEVVSVAGASQSFESVIGGLVCTDTLIHTWDLLGEAAVDAPPEPE